jgi:hypothetical protein
MSKLLFINILIFQTIASHTGWSQNGSVQSSTAIECPAIQIETSVVAPDPGQKNGSIELKVTGGDQPYQFYWINSSSDLPNQSKVSGLAKGFYSVVVVDKNRCSKTLMNINVGVKPENNQ